MSDRQEYPAWLYRQSAALPYRWHGTELEVLLITSRKGKHWILPKGIVEPGLTARASAAKEALEEAGVVGAMGSTSLGSYRHRKWGGTCEVAVYPLRVQHEHDDWPESAIRRRRWHPLADALRRVDDPGLRAVIARLTDMPSPTEDRAEPTEQPPDERPPPRLLHLLRHAKSSWDHPELADLDRPLAPRGERAADAMRQYLAVADIRPALVLCSPAVRARQTLERVRPALGDGAVVEIDGDLYGRGPWALIDLVRDTGPEVGGVMLVGHNPDVHSLATLLVGGGDEADRARLAEKYPTGALATMVLRDRPWSSLGPATCDLHSFVRPRDLPPTRSE